MRALIVRLFLVLVVVLAAAGCVVGQPQPLASASSFNASTSSTSSAPSTAATGYELTGPPRPSTLEASQSSSASIVVRPDMLSVAFAVRTTAAEPDAGLAVLERIVREDIVARFSELTPAGTMTLHMRGAQVDRITIDVGKKSSQAARASEGRSPARFAVAVQGSLVFAFSPNQDYWERARLVARIDGLREKVVLAGSTSHEYEATLEQAHVAVRDTEAHRAELLERWVARRKQFLRESKTVDVTVANDSCKPPSEIVVRALSLEEIELSLPVECATLRGKGG